MSSPASLTDLLARIRPESTEGRATVRDILHRIGEDSFAPAILVPALLLVSPLSGIPGSPTIGALIIITIAVQWVIGRDHLSLPGFLMNRSVSAERLDRALTYLAKPAAWFDRHSRDRLQLLVMPPFSLIAKLCVLIIPMFWPLLELVPMVTSFGAGAVSLFAFGMMMRDGLYVVAGFVTIGGLLSLFLWITGAA